MAQYVCRSELWKAYENKNKHTHTDTGVSLIVSELSHHNARNSAS